MKTVLMILMMAQEHDFGGLEFKPTEKEAVVCRTHKVTRHTECSKPIDSRKAHEYVRGAEKGGSPEWTYAYHTLTVYRILTAQRQKAGE